MSAAVDIATQTPRLSARRAKKRGRPTEPILNKQRPMVTHEYVALRSARAIANKCWEWHAIESLTVESPRWGWLFDLDAMAAGTFRPPSSVLAELGRLRDDYKIWAMARRLLELDPRPSIGEAVQIVRAARREGEAEDVRRACSLIIPTREARS